MSKLCKFKSSIISGIAYSLAAYAAFIALAPCTGFWFQPKTPARLQK